MLVKVRDMIVADLDELLDVQEAGAVVALAPVFPQDRYPFPRDVVQRRWRAEIADSNIGTYVAVDPIDARILGFAATNAGELLHFGTALETWGTGVAGELLDEVVPLLRQARTEPVLRVFAENRRGRRFYEKHGWRATGESTVSTFEPNPVLLTYALPPSD